MPRCNAKSAKTGLRCKNNAKPGQCFCINHITNTNTTTTQNTSNNGQDTDIAQSQMEDINFVLQMPFKDPMVTVPIIEQNNDKITTHHHNNNEDIQALREEIKVLTQIVQQLVNVIHQNTQGTKFKTPKIVKKTPKTALIQAKWEFYNQHKEDTDIITDLQARMLNAGLPVSNGCKPWQFIKYATDWKFDQMSDNDKNNYISRYL